ncbi:DUF3732 domain-containing protein [Cellvibrio fontiphilus]|uniref:DUF3732 domain-containing protein n=1 Tax=Cellvibrio fontiphilus TaxID=1815559 RepID=A0ABV7FII5_9GAMM
MKFQIDEVILWSKTGDKIRRLKFHPGVVNVISGASKTGKSAVIPIIDYCLASKNCKIPVGVIRDTCAWFGLLVTTQEGQKLFARREPGDQKSTEDMYIVEGIKVDLPEVISNKNSSTKSAKAIFDRLAGLGNLGFDPDSASGFKARPGFRDLMAFTFQPQNIVANPDVLFYKADTTEHREKLKTIFPYVLGAITPKILAARWELDGLRKEMRRKESELRALSNVSVRWRAEIATWFDMARSYGLITSEDLVPVEWDQSIEYLKKLVKKSSRNAEQTIEGMDKVLRDLEAMRNTEREVASSLFTNRERLNEIAQLKDSASDFDGAVSIQRERLSLSKWLSYLSTSEENVLSGLTLNPSDELQLLCKALSEIEIRSGISPQIADSIDSELVRLKAEVRKDMDLLAATRARIRTLEDAHANVKSNSQNLSNVDRFLGRIEQALETYRNIGTDTELLNEIRRLQEKIDLVPKFSEEDIRNRTKVALKSIQDICTEIIPKLDAEWADAFIRLSITDLTVRVLRDGRSDFLWEVGSGANWLAYHVTMTLALQKYFMERESHPVPHFLIFDQPSQVYFPRRLAGDEAAIDKNILKDEDRNAVRKVFKVLDATVAESKNKFQIIVLDHAGDEVWGDLPCVKLVEEWRNNKKLVPLSWL